MSKKSKKVVKHEDTELTQEGFKTACRVVEKIEAANNRYQASRAVAGWVTEMLEDYYPPILNSTYAESVARSMWLARTTPPPKKWEDKLIESGATPEHLWGETEYGSRLPSADLMQILNDFGDEYLALMDNFFNRIDALEACEA
ncbi:hypothetical protein [Polynucleobacter sp. es-MAR-4]|uniref:hypothetical protein n=1 Tax=Polynucleobacter sp. es-MAR-4 TaxID=1855655 RepID=UPI001C0B6747|nr:hypothetical protein [Polynucleobacter sp. es-MAR-4]MBU3637373.1 hypothetical protein [Polynucleobacter sp. es-MAR-4]